MHLSTLKMDAREWKIKKWKIREKVCSVWYRVGLFNILQAANCSAQEAKGKSHHSSAPEINAEIRREAKIYIFVSAFCEFISLHLCMILIETRSMHIIPKTSIPHIIENKECRFVTFAFTLMLPCSHSQSHPIGIPFEMVRKFALETPCRAQCLKIHWIPSHHLRMQQPEQMFSFSLPSLNILILSCCISLQVFFICT